MKSAEQFITFGQGNVEALVKSSQIVATGLQNLSKQMAAHAQATMEESMSVFRAMTGVRSFREALELQTSFARASIEKTVAHTSQIAEASFKLAEQAYEPLAGRVNYAVESIKTV